MVRKGTLWTVAAVAALLVAVIGDHSSDFTRALAITLPALFAGLAGLSFGGAES